MTGSPSSTSGSRPCSRSAAIPSRPGSSTPWPNAPGQLGWARERVVVIDDDLGRSGASAEVRPGFQRLVAEVGLGRVGLVLGVEVSRLARSCRDWHQLLEICALFDTLIADSDGVYDPAAYNDRLLLGLKGTMSEAELHILKGRMDAGRRAKAGRGELFFNLPRGYVRRPSGRGRARPRRAGAGRPSGWSSTCSSSGARSTACWSTWPPTTSGCRTGCAAGRARASSSGAARTGTRSARC